MEALTSSQVACSIPGGIDFSDMRAVNVCGANCPDREQVAQELREQGVSVHQNGCHGMIGGCAVAGVLTEGTYATVPERTETGVRMTEVVVRTN